MKEFDVILAVGGKTKNIIGVKNTLPWKNIKLDMIHFRKITSHVENPDKINAVIMGRKTWESLPEKHRPLCSRLNMVLTKNKDYNIDDKSVVIKSNFNDAFLSLAGDDRIERIFVIGGKTLYEESFKHPNLKNIYLTTLEFKPEFFDKYESSDLVCVDGLNLEKHKLIWQTDPTYIKSELDDTEDVNVIFAKYENCLASHPETQYLNLIKKIMEKGTLRQTRNSATLSIFGESFTYDIGKDGFPIITTKRVGLRLVFEELKFFLLGQTDSKILSDKKVHIWDANTTREFLNKINLPHYEVGTMGPMYGFNWLHFGAKYIDSKTDYTDQGVNQFSYVIDTLMNDPFSRRIMMTTFNPSVTSESVLWPCHGIVVQFGCEDNDKTRFIHCNMYQRSCDTICGLPFNISSYALLMYIICEIINNKNDVEACLPLYKPGKLNIYLGDTHIYYEETHLAAVDLHLSRQPHKLPSISFNKKFTDVSELEWEDLELTDYKCHPTIKVNMVA